MALESPAAQTKGAAHSRAAWRTALRRVPIAMWDDNVADWAAALTYYAVLALVPALLVTLSLIGLVSPDLTDRLIGNVTALAPAQASAAFRETLTQMAHERSAALTVAITGGIASLWSASSHLAVFRRALHAMHGVPDRRAMWRRLHRIILTALSLLALLVTSALVLVLTGPLAETLGRDVGLGRAATATWYFLRWPLLLCLVGLTVLILFRSGPPAFRQTRHAVPGGALATVLWLITSAAFSVYTSVFGTYGRLYGSLAGAVVFLVWLWLSHLALLAGAQFAVELSKADREGSPPD